MLELPLPPTYQYCPPLQARLQAVAKYVAQTDDMFPSLTVSTVTHAQNPPPPTCPLPRQVRETLTTAAALYVDEPAASRERRVTEVMTMLGLAAQAEGEDGWQRPMPVTRLRHHPPLTLVQ